MYFRLHIYSILHTHIKVTVFHWRKSHKTIDWLHFGFVITKQKAVSMRQNNSSVFLRFICLITHRPWLISDFYNFFKISDFSNFLDCFSNSTSPMRVLRHPWLSPRVHHSSDRSGFILNSVHPHRRYVISCPFQLLPYIFLCIHK